MEIEKYYHKSDALVVGTGLAGLRAALALADAGIDTITISKVYPTRSHSVSAQGGIAAAIAHASDDSTELHMWDTVKGSDYLGDQDAIEMFVNEAIETVYEMEHMGVVFSRMPDGRIAQRRFGGHSRPRAVYAADYTGHVLLHTLFEQCIKKRVRFFNEFFVLKLVYREDGVVSGVIAWDIRNGGLHIFNAKATLFATGGFGRAFKITSNSFANTGDGLALVLREGLPIEDLEFVQFHPTGLYRLGILVTEGARGEGGYLLNGKGERFMKNYAPEKMELAPRDVVSRAIQTEINEGRGIDGKDYVYIDLRHLGAEKIKERLPQIRELAMNFVGVDPIKEPIPIQPTAHYQMGGIPTTKKGEVTKDSQNTIVPGFYAAGECACVSIHGANRLGTNSQQEAITMGRIAGEAMAEFVKKADLFSIPEQAIEEAEAYVRKYLEGNGSVRPAELREKLHETMTNKVGIFRNEKDLSEAVKEVRELEEQIPKIKVEDKGFIFNLDLQEALETENLILFSEIVAAGALNRKESRGAHYRVDYPKRDDENWLKHTLAWKTPEGVKFDYKPVVITKYQPQERKY
ncbi:MAG: succinate dehydrogenase flavoprotein subunit [Candidatus Aminicenantes bacterium]|nr:succinate dehydrogenase flavoprotein subunit [Candidatus Aminicenantes bacterium]